jgi:hypothetical protein
MMKRKFGRFASAAERPKAPATRKGARKNRERVRGWTRDAMSDASFRGELWPGSIVAWIAPGGKAEIR